jgi:hypothetical protein
MTRIANALAEVDIASTCAVFLRGSIAAHWPSIVPAWAELLRIAGWGRALPRCRRGAQSQWRQLPVDWEQVPSLFDGMESGAGCRRLEVAMGEGREAVTLEWVDLLPVLGEERASHIRMRFPQQSHPVDRVQIRS